jgi:hypothetical protein
MLCSASVQEVMDFALISQAATLESRIPFLHFFDGFRTSHEVMKIEQLADEDLRAMISDELIRAHRSRSLSPDHPVMRGSAMNPDVYFQARETVNPFYDACPAIVQKAMDKFAALVGRQYRLFEYIGSPNADRVVILMGSGLGAEEGGKSRRPESAALPAILHRCIRRCTAEVSQDNYRSRQNKGTGRSRRAVVSGRHHGNHRTPQRRDFAASNIPAHHLGTLRPVIKGIYTRHGQGGV